MDDKHYYEVIDTHAHLDEIDGLDRVISEAKRIGVKAIIAVGQDYESNCRVLEIAEQYRSFVYPALGLHPWNLGAMDKMQIDRNYQFIEDNIASIVGIGEIGLDYHKRVKAVAGKEQQQDVLRSMLELARKNNKPVSLHSRYAWKDCLELVKESGVKRAVFHWYTGLSSVLREIIDRGYWISATPAGEYHDEHKRAIRETPQENLLLETDSPVKYGRDERYESRPSDITRSLRAVALIKGLDEAEVASCTTENAIRLFGLSDEN